MRATRVAGASRCTSLPMPGPLFLREREARGIVPREGSQAAPRRRAPGRQLRQLLHRQWRHRHAAARSAHRPRGRAAPASACFPGGACVGRAGARDPARRRQHPLHHAAGTLPEREPGHRLRRESGSGRAACGIVRGMRSLRSARRGWPALLADGIDRARAPGAGRARGRARAARRAGALIVKLRPCGVARWRHAGAPGRAWRDAPGLSVARLRATSSRASSCCACSCRPGRRPRSRRWRGCGPTATSNTPSPTSGATRWPCPMTAVRRGQWYLQSEQPAALDAVDAWDVTTGSTGLVIADLDTGVRFDHPDLRNDVGQPPAARLRHDRRRRAGQLPHRQRRRRPRCRRLRPGRLGIERGHQDSAVQQLHGRQQQLARHAHRRHSRRHHQQRRRHRRHHLERLDPAGAGARQVRRLRLRHPRRHGLGGRHARRRRAGQSLSGADPQHEPGRGRRLPARLPAADRPSSRPRACWSWCRPATRADRWMRRPTAPAWSASRACATSAPRSASAVWVRRSRSAPRPAIASTPAPASRACTRSPRPPTPARRCRPPTPTPTRSASTSAPASRRRSSPRPPA